MERQLEFKRLAIRTNVAVLLGGAVGIPLALAGAGVWALVGAAAGDGARARDAALGDDDVAASVPLLAEPRA